MKLQVKCKKWESPVQVYTLFEIHFKSLISWQRCESKINIDQAIFGAKIQIFFRNFWEWNCQPLWYLASFSW